MIFVFILLLMVFCHIIDDYYLQGILANMKQKSWWEKNAPNEMYKKDYIMALLMHSFSWSFMIMLPITIYTIVYKAKLLPLFYIINMVIHCIVDDLKANKKKINLIQDQLIHLLQILITWIYFICVN